MKKKNWGLKIENKTNIDNKNRVQIILTALPYINYNIIVIII